MPRSASAASVTTGSLGSLSMASNTNGTVLLTDRIVYSPSPASAREAQFADGHGTALELALVQVDPLDRHLSVDHLLLAVVFVELARQMPLVDDRHLERFARVEQQHAPWRRRGSASSPACRRRRRSRPGTGPGSRSPARRRTPSRAAVIGVVKPAHSNCTPSRSYRSSVPLWIWTWNWFLAGSSRFCVGTATSTPSGISIFGSVVVVAAGSVGGGVVAALVGGLVAGSSMRRGGGRRARRRRDSRRGCRRHRGVGG